MLVKVARFNINSSETTSRISIKISSSYQPYADATIDSSASNDDFIQTNPFLAKKGPVVNPSTSYSITQQGCNIPAAPNYGSDFSNKSQFAVDSTPIVNLPPPSEQQAEATIANLISVNNLTYMPGQGFMCFPARTCQL